MNKNAKCPPVRRPSRQDWRVVKTVWKVEVDPMGSSMSKQECPLQDLLNPKQDTACWVRFHSSSVCQIPLLLLLLFNRQRRAKSKRTLHVEPYLLCLSLQCLGCGLTPGAAILKAVSRPPVLFACIVSPTTICTHHDSEILLKSMIATHARTHLSEIHMYKKYTCFLEGDEGRT